MNGSRVRMLYDDSRKAFPSRCASLALCETDVISRGDGVYACHPYTKLWLVIKWAGWEAVFTPMTRFLLARQPRGARVLHYYDNTQTLRYHEISKDEWQTTCDMICLAKLHWIPH